MTELVVKKILMPLCFRLIFVFYDVLVTESFTQLTYVYISYKDGIDKIFTCSFLTRMVLTRSFPIAWVTDEGNFSDRKLESLIVRKDSSSFDLSLSFFSLSLLLFCMSVCLSLSLSVSLPPPLFCARQSTNGVWTVQ